MGSVGMETDEGIITDYGLWDRTFMEVDLLDTDVYRTDTIDYFNGHDFFLDSASDPLLPLLNSLVASEGRHDDDCDQFVFPSSREGRRGEGSSNACHKYSELDLSFSMPDAACTAARIQEVAASFPLGEIIIKSEPCDVRGSWLNPNGFDSDTSSTGSGGSRSPSQSHGKGSGFNHPPTPPCSSDGDSLASPLCTPTSRVTSSSSSLNLATAISQSVRLSTGDDGSLLLTEEEKRTLTAEGYPIPSRLPLTKAEERSLKRIRRKIKNKISAQESRRKKKEYIESLEKKVKLLNDDNSDLRRKLDVSESTHRSLADQLCKYQTLLKAKVQITPVRRVIPTQTEKNS